ncbi:hypothetical protein [Flavobacterium sp. 245]|uniref:hypothetical protein n=1 Tax=Flavobacterium sp. 245 TaxID=2512115 RepID=UPI00105FC743|nr:hypothetical protein [Flavobacterium sp. 245]TDO94892.1 hypothetical protein EV145_11616 [Flavobacterium sp. 245]
MERSYAGTVARKNFCKTEAAAVIIIESKNEKNIIKYSDLQTEAEVLHKSKSSFILESVKEDQLLNAFEHQYDYQPAIRGKVFTIIEK